MEIHIVGWPNVKTYRVLDNVRAAAAGTGERPSIVWINDVATIATMGPITIPAVIMNGKVKMAGHIPSVYEVQTWIAETVRMEFASWS